MTFSDELWASVADLRARIDRLPFLTALEDGSLPRERFDHYLAQDALYLLEYARALAFAAARAGTADEVAFWAEAATGAVREQRELHDGRAEGPGRAAMSPTCAAYTGFLLATCAAEPYAVVTAAVLPCFCVYDDVGTRLAARVGDPAAHPYGDWIATYGDPAFTAATTRARGLVDAAAERASAAERERMRPAFTTAVRYELLFWDAAWREETWPA